MKDKIQRYFNAWSSQRFSDMRDCLADEIMFDMGGSQSTISAENFIKMSSDGPSWKDIRLLDAVYEGDKAALLYEGVNAATGQRLRVGEFIQCSDGKIAGIRAVLYSDAG